jgi:uncharacterized protein YdiU (UPF0061 family)
MTVHFPFDNTYSSLPDRFYARIHPTPVTAPRLIRLNRTLAAHLNLDPDWLASPEGVETLAGKRIPEAAEPIALAYAGHQFGNFVPQLGDGRAILLGEVVDRDRVRRDIQLKGSGPTPFSRRGDGRAALGPVLREYIVSEAMAALGIPTTRALAVVTTGDTVVRESVLPGGVLTRVASSHVRVGTFEYFAARGDTEAIRTLADYVIARHYPEAQTTGQPYRTLLEQVIGRQAELIARWLLVGFIHGVMNTDNMAISGETIDYGPCAFLDAYDPAKVFSSIDQYGRYAYGNQPRIAVWNLTRLAEAMLPLLGDDIDDGVHKAKDALATFEPTFESAYHTGLSRKLGLLSERGDDRGLSGDLLKVMAENQVDFTLFFRRLSDAGETPEQDEPVRSLFVNPLAFDNWAARWRERLRDEPQDVNTRQAAMRAVNPAYIPRNHRIEAAISAAVKRADFSLFHALVAVTTDPYREEPSKTEYARPPDHHEQVQQTFCGT